MFNATHQNKNNDDEILKREKNKKKTQGNRTH